MKKAKKKVITYVFITIAGICFIGVFIGMMLWFKPWTTYENSFPDDGVWFCKDNYLAIDFTLMDKYGYERCAVKYDTPDKTTCELVYPKITINSNQITIESSKSDTVYLSGYADYSDNVFKIRANSSDKTYIFERISDESLDDELAKLDN